MDNTVAVPRGWDERQIPDQSGRRYLITGGTSGLGLASARILRSRGAHVTITARDVDRARSVVAAGGADAVIEMDLSDLASVRRGADLASDPFHVVMLNAGVMWTPYTLTTDGFELQMSTNHLGHFALAGLIADRVLDRLVTVSSLYQRYGTLGDHSPEAIERRCRGRDPYVPSSAYGDSKLANMLFAAEVQRRRVDHGWGFHAVAAHPGWTSTNLFRASAAGRGVMGRAALLSSRVLAQRPARGALPQLCAATFEGLRGGEYLGPRGPGELRGTPHLSRPSVLACDETLAANLWRVSEELTGVVWP